MTDNNELKLENTKLSLKVAALRERISELENACADYRVEITILSERLRQAEEPSAEEEADESE